MYFLLVIYDLNARLGKFNYSSLFVIYFEVVLTIDFVLFWFNWLGYDFSNRGFTLLYFILYFWFSVLQFLAAQRVKSGGKARKTRPHWAKSQENLKISTQRAGEFGKRPLSVSLLHTPTAAGALPLPCLWLTLSLSPAPTLSAALWAPSPSPSPSYPACDIYNVSLQSGSQFAAARATARVREPERWLGAATNLFSAFFIRRKTPLGPKALF